MPLASLSYMKTNYLPLLAFLCFSKAVLSGPKDVLRNVSPPLTQDHSVHLTPEVVRVRSSALPYASSRFDNHQSAHSDEASRRDARRKAVMKELFSDSSEDTALGEEPSSATRSSFNPSGSQRRTMQEGSQRSLRLLNTDKFKSEWVQRGLGTHLPPEKLARGVARLRESGLNANVASKLALKVVQDRKDSQYLAKYNHQVEKIGHRLRFNRVKLRRETNLKPEQVEKVALIRALDPFYTKRVKEPRLSGQKRLTPSKQAKADGTAQKGAAILASFEQHLNTKQMHLATAPLEALAEESRLYPATSPAQRRDLYFHLKRYLGRERKIPEADVKAMTKVRAADGARTHNRNYKAKKRQKVIDLREKSVAGAAGAAGAAAAATGGGSSHDRSSL